MLWANEKDTVLFACRQSSHAVGLSCLLLIEVGGKEMLTEAGHYLTISEEVGCLQGLDREEVVVEIDELFAEVRYAM